jgi:hypothetical protein
MVAGCSGLRGGDRAGLNVGPKRRNTRRLGLFVQQSGDTFGDKTPLPPPDRRLARASTPGEFDRAAAVRCQKHNLRHQTCFCGLFRSAKTAIRAWRSVSSMSIVIALRIRRTCIETSPTALLRGKGD